MSDRPIKVMLLSVATGGGVRKVQSDLAQGLAEKGFEISVVSLKQGPPYLDTLDEGVTRLSLGTRNPVRFFAELTRHLRQVRPDVVIASQDQTVIPMAILRTLRVWTRPAVAVVHNNPMVHKRATSALARLMPIFTRFAYNRSNWVVTVSRGLRDALIADKILSPQTSSTIYNGIVPVAINGVRPADMPDKFILSVGNLNNQKDFATLIEAFALMQEDYSGDLVILGEGQNRDSLQSQIQHLGLQEKVHLPGFRDPSHYYLAADVFAVSSAWEGFSLVSVEALSTGCPAVATRCDFGPPEILDNGRFGPLVPVGDAQALATALQDVIAKPLAREVLVARSAEFSLSRCADNYAKLVRSLLQNKHAG